jgi:hypothetical protein
MSILIRGLPHLLLGHIVTNLATNLIPTTVFICGWKQFYHGGTPVALVWDLSPANGYSAVLHLTTFMLS